MTTESVTVTLPVELLERIDRVDRNRSRFIAEAVERELTLRRRDGLMRSLDTPHPESAALARLGVDDWATSLPLEVDGLVVVTAGRPVRWVDGQGWIEEPT